MTQPIFDPGALAQFRPTPGWQITSAGFRRRVAAHQLKQALRLNNEVPGIVIPERTLKELEAAGTSARDRGFALAKVMLDWARTEVAGGLPNPSIQALRRNPRASVTPAASRRVSPACATAKPRAPVRRRNSPARTNAHDSKSGVGAALVYPEARRAPPARVSTVSQSKYSDALSGHGFNRAEPAQNYSASAARGSGSGSG